jgi:hypothetical protein
MIGKHVASWPSPFWRCRTLARSGREYQVSSDADLYMNSYGLVDDINPGNAIEVKVPFDVPPDTQMSMLELHDSMFSAGVRVAPAPGP